MGYSDEKELSFSIERFTGIDQGLEGNDTPMHASPDAENCDTSGGVLKPACGWAVDDTMGAAPGDIRSLMSFYKHDAEGAVIHKILAATKNGDIHDIYQNSGGSWVSIKGSFPVTSSRYSHINYKKNDNAMIIMANGTDNVYSWDGTAATIAKLAANAPWVEGRPIADKESNLIRLTNHGLKDNEAVAFYADKGKLPGGLVVDDTYFVKERDSHTFKVGTKKSGDAVANIKDNGTNGWRVARLAWIDRPNDDAPASADPATDLITVNNHSLSQNEVVVFDPWDGSLPGGISANKGYYVYLYNTNRFYLTTSADNLDDKVNITSPGSNFRVRRHTQTSWVTGAPTANCSTELITFTGHGLKDKAAVEFGADAGGAVPVHIVAHDGTDNGKYYYVVKATANTFRLADKPGGAPIGVSSSGNKFHVRLSRENRPMGRSLALHAERVWCAGEKTRPNSAFFSDDMNPTNWAIGTDSAGEIAKPTWDGDAVTAVANLFDSIVVFKSRSMFRIAGTTPGDYQVTPVLSTAGTLSPASICQWQNAAFFLSPTGIMAYDGMKCELLGGDALKGFWPRLNTDPDALAGACGTVHQGKLLMALPVDNSAVNNCVVEYDIGQGTFMLRTGVSVAAWLPGDTLRFASGNRVCVWGQGFRTYGGQPIPMRWKTPESDFGDRGALKIVTGVLVSGKGGVLSITVRADGREAQKTVTLPQTAGTVKAGVRIKGRSISMELANVEGSAIELNGVTVLYEREED